MVPYIPLTSPRVRGGLGCDSKGCRHRRWQIRSEGDSAICGTLSRPGARTVPSGAFRSVLTKSLLFLPLPPIVSGRSRKVACLLQIASESYREESHLFPVP